MQLIVTQGFGNHEMIVTQGYGSGPDSYQPLTTVGGSIVQTGTLGDIVRSAARGATGRGSIILVDHRAQGNVEGNNE